MNHVYFTGQFDGCNLWMQWDLGAAEGIGYRVQWRSRLPGGEWGEWQTLGQIVTRPWLSLPLWREGHEVQAAVAEDREGAPIVQAQEVTFRKPFCRFELRNERPIGGRVARFEPGTKFICTVDEAPCAYVLQDDLLLEPGESSETVMLAASAVGWSQLDAPDDFFIRPALGVVLRNVEPSTQDVEPTGRDYTVMQAVKPDGPMLVSFRKAQVR